MIHPDTELRFVSDTIGYGVFARKFIPKGTITYVRDSLEIYISPDEFDKHSIPVQDVIEKYSFIDENGYRIVSWDFAKYVNHCCNCNTMSTGYGFEIAIRDIEPGEEITDEYGIFNMKNEMPLACGKENCRGKVCSSDLDAFYPQWDETLKEAMKNFSKVNQPLFPFVDDITRSEVEKFLKDPSTYRSVYYLKNNLHELIKRSQ